MSIKIPATPERRQLLDIYRQSTTQQLLVARLAQVAGLTVVEDRLNRSDNNYRCIQYAFGSRHKHPWAKPSRNLPDSIEVWYWQRDFILKQGYKVVPEPNKGGLVGYGQGPFCHHFGICEDVGRMLITSKWGSGPIVRHPLGLVRESYGNEVTFFKRTR